MGFCLRLMFILMFLLSTTVADTKLEEWDTEFDKPFEFKCEPNRILTRIVAEHNNSYEDRVFKFHCCNAPVTGQLKNCNWSDVANQFEQPMLYQCPGDGIITGVYGEHNDFFEDRQFKFLCCGIEDMAAHSCTYSKNLAKDGWENSLDGRLDYSVPGGYVLTGVISIHHNEAQDRIFVFQICKLDSL